MKNSKLPLLVIVSPLPPEQSGISYYTEALLPALNKFYTIVLIHPEFKNLKYSFDLNNKPIQVHPPAWLNSVHAKYARIIYQIGNSHFHSWMLQLMLHHPGVIVLHDFYLSHLMYDWCNQFFSIQKFTSLLYYCHGYKSLQQYAHDINQASDDFIWKYCINQKILQTARGVLIHSQHIRKLAKINYNVRSLQNWHNIPMLANARIASSANELKWFKQHSNSSKHKIICSFGYIGPLKLSLEIIQAFIQSNLASKGWILFLAGSEGGDKSYNNKLHALIKNNNLENIVLITGWLSNERYSCLLDKTDISIQLRTNSRGETSAAVMDCLKSDSALIINDHGSLSEIPDDICIKLPEKFNLSNLSEAMIFLADNNSSRDALGIASKKYCNLHHSADKCAEAYYHTVENIYSSSIHPLDAVKVLINDLSYNQLPELEQIKLINRVAAENPSFPAQKRLFVDVSAVAEEDLRSGVQRVTNKICRELFEQIQFEWIVEPVRYNKNTKSYVTATSYSCSLLEVPSYLAPLEAPVLPNIDDIFLVLDLNHSVIEAKKEWLNYIKLRGAQVWFIVYDLLPCQFPDYFPRNTNNIHAQWLTTVSTATGAICISKTVANDLHEWMLKNIAIDQANLLNIQWFHLGSDFKKPPEFPSISVKRSSNLVKFLMVGTIEPRKGYLEVLKAMQILWEKGISIKLTIVGQEGWKALPDISRQNIPETIILIRFLESRFPNMLTWLDNATDEQLFKCYKSSEVLIAASYGEGFGLPLIEARNHGLSIIARDIPIFREVLNNHAQFFSSNNHLELADWLLNWNQNRHASITKYSDNLIFDTNSLDGITWAESCKQLIEILDIN